MGHPPGLGEHNAAFYLTEAFLIPHVASFLSDGLEAGEQVLVIATLPHWNLLAAHFEQTGGAHGRATAEGRLVWVDAEDLLEKITVAEVVSVDRFRTAVGKLLSPGRPWRVYGELVSLLAARGDLDTALAMEALGHELAETHNARVLCGYHLHAGLTPASVRRLDQVHHRTMLEPTPPSRARLQ
jgi:hypothetical protein